MNLLQMKHQELIKGSNAHLQLNFKSMHPVYTPIEDLWEDMSDGEDSGPVKEAHVFENKSRRLYSIFDLPDMANEPEVEKKKTLPATPLVVPALQPTPQQMMQQFGINAASFFSQFPASVVGGRPNGNGGGLLNPNVGLEEMSDDD